MDTRAPAEPSPWLPFESRRRARDEKREAVLRTAVQVFLEQGYHRATLNDVAERLNITKPALYNYFGGKDEILFECWAVGQERVDECIAAINAGDGNGLDKLRRLTRAYGEMMATDFGASLVRFDVRDLTDKNSKTVRAAKRRYRCDLSQLHHRRHRRRLDQALRRQARGLRHRRIAELDRALVSA
jgi:AcrR family transcriptional regulator